jgi:hypothetical protein
VDLNQIYQKSAKGLEEIRSRRHRLPKHPRVLLILVDGRTPLETVLGQARALGIEDSTVFELIAEGFIEQVARSSGDLAYDPAVQGDPGERFRLAQALMNDSMVNALGLRALFFTLKLERCSTLEDLQALLPSYQAALLKAGEDAQVRVLTTRLKSLIW